MPKDNLSPADRAAALAQAAEEATKAREAATEAAERMERQGAQDLADGPDAGRSAAGRATGGAGGTRFRPPAYAPSDIPGVAGGDMGFNPRENGLPFAPEALTGGDLAKGHMKQSSPAKGVDFGF